MTDKPSEAALRKAHEVLRVRVPGRILLVEGEDIITNLASHFDAEDDAARDALRPMNMYARMAGLEGFAERYILPDPKPTVADVVEAWRETPGRTTEALATMLRDAGLLREDW